MIASKKKPGATKCSEHRSISLIAHTAKIVEQILGLKGMLRTYSEKISLDLEEEKERRMLRIIAERTLEIDTELCICFMDWQKTYDRVN